MAGQDKEKVFNITVRKGNRRSPIVNAAVDFLARLPQNFQNSLKTCLKQVVKNKQKLEAKKLLTGDENGSCDAWEANLDKQMKAWKENPSWVDQPPNIKVSAPAGSFCNLNLAFNVGLPPDAIFNIVIDPENRRVFKNIKEVTFRKVLIDEGHRQVVELEQAAIWRFLWWSGTISVHVMVDQNRNDHSLKFKQGKTGFMKQFEGCWKVEPLFIDEKLCHPFKPKTWAEYETSTRGKGRVASVVSLDQLIQPALVPPPPLSWYLRGITAKTTEMLINDLQAEAARIREALHDSELSKLEANNVQDSTDISDEMKKRWNQRRRNKRRRKRMPSPVC